MDTSVAPKQTRRLLFRFCLLAGFFVPLVVHAGPDRPKISSIRLEATNVVVTVDVPSGVRRVTLECRQRLGRGAWEPRSVARTDGSATMLTFRLARSRHLELMRVRADASEPLPAAFYSGTTSFVNQAASSGLGPGILTLDSRNDVPAPSVADTRSRQVVESDIWKIHGQTLYFFNQYRGLQVIDISDPDAAVVRGMLDLPAAGEQMYLLDDNHLILLARDDCRWLSSGPENRVLIVNVKDQIPRVVASLSVAGYIQESRLIGTALYVAAQTSRPLPMDNNGATWEWGTLVSSFDLGNPSNPVARNTLWYSGYGNTVAANDVFLFVVTEQPSTWTSSVVRCIDITNPDGAMAEYASIQTAGRVEDKFKLNWSDSVFTAVSQNSVSNMLATKLETFRLPHPLSAGPVGVIKLGELGLAVGERLHATRFDGRRVYIVTFGERIRIDPFWIVDLSDASRPRITGELEVPGFSTFLHSMGDRVVAVGVETNQVAVSLFDVANPAQPGLLSRVLVGEGFSWTEANFDEKAFNVLEEAGLILLPFSSSGSNGYVQAVQLVDLNRDVLRARGVIEHDFWPRRATLHQNRLLSLSSTKLLSADVTDRDHPIVRGSTPLAWPVNRVFVTGDYLLELSTSSDGYLDAKPTLRVTRANDANDILSFLELGDGPVIGATVRGNRLFVLQGRTTYPPDQSETDGTNAPEPRTSITLTIFGLDALPKLVVAGQTTATVSSDAWLGDFDAVWPKPGVLVWASSGGGFPRWQGPWFWDLRVAVGGFWWPYWSGSGGQLFAFDVSNAAAPAFGSEVNLGNDGWWSFSKAFATDGLVYLSHSISTYWPVLYPIALPIDPAADFVVAAKPIGQWTQQAFLDVIDYTDVEEPLVREPVNIPGALQGISRDGALLYTVGTRRTEEVTDDWTEHLAASAYDGVAAHLVDSIALGQYPHPVLVSGVDVFVGKSGYAIYPATNHAAPTLETWTLADSGKFDRQGMITLETPANMLGAFSGFLAAEGDANFVLLFDAADPAALRKIGQGQPFGCIGFNLNREDGNRERGLFLPLDFYGVATVPVSSP
jgi:hypothetical protein